MQTTAPMIRVFPAEGVDPVWDETLKQVRDCIASPEKNFLLKSSLRSHCAKALIITPEYDLSREADTGKKLVFHVLMEKKEPGTFELAALTSDIGNILGQDGFSIPFDEKHVPTLPAYFGAEQSESLFRRIINTFASGFYKRDRNGPR
jgi:hypothetical protein